MLAPRVRLYIAVVGLLGVLAQLAVAFVPGPPPTLLVLAAALGAALTATATVPLPGSGVRLNADAPFLLALVLLGAGREAVLLSGLGAAFATYRSGVGYAKPHAVVLNAGAATLAAFGAVGLFGLARRLGLVEPLPALLASGALFGANSAVVAGVLRLTRGELPQAWREGQLVTGLGYLASGSIAWLVGAVPHGFSLGLLAAPLAALVWQAYRERAHRTHDRDEVFLPTLKAICAAIEARDPLTHGHNQRVEALSVDLAAGLGLRDPEQLTALRLGALLHDIGKLAVPDGILHAGRDLSAEEILRCRRHPAIGADLVRHVPLPPGVLEVVRHHHERWDGDGYPDRLAKLGIPPLARIVAVVEAYEDLRSDRALALSEQDALTAVLREAGTAYDPEMARIFVERARARAGHVAEPESVSWRQAAEAIAASSKEQAWAAGLAWADEVTGLGNARALARDLERLQGAEVGLLVLDLDGFKGINDTYGHAFGDRALRLAGVALAAVQGREVAAYRNGGDEFAVVVRVGGEAGLAEAKGRVRGALEAVELPVGPGRVVPLRASIGAAWGATSPDLLRRADAAMYEDKHARREGRERGAPPIERQLATGP